MTQEERLKRQLEALYTEYKHKAAPILAKLAEIDALKPPKPVFLCPKCYRLMNSDGCRSLICNPRHGG